MKRVMLMALVMLGACAPYSEPTNTPEQEGPIRIYTLPDGTRCATTGVYGGRVLDCDWERDR